MNQLLTDPAILRELIMDHYQHPRNRHLTDSEGYETAHMASDSCIDDIKVQAKIKDHRIEDVCFDGVACTISTASTSMMTELLKGKTIEEANHIIENYFAMIDEREFDEDLLQEAIAMRGVSKQANRIKCATIGWNGIVQLIKESGDHS